MKKITGFECSYCSRFLKSKAGIIKHENNCSSNPENNKPSKEQLLKLEISKGAEEIRVSATSPLI